MLHDLYTPVRPRRPGVCPQSGPSPDYRDTTKRRRDTVLAKPWLRLASNGRVNRAIGFSLWQLALPMSEHLASIGTWAISTKISSWSNFCNYNHPGALLPYSETLLSVDGNLNTPGKNLEQQTFLSLQFFPRQPQTASLT